MDDPCRGAALQRIEADRRLCGREMTNFAIGICRRTVVGRLDVDRAIGMLVMAKVGRHLGSLVLAIARRRSEGSLERHQQQQEEGDEAAHALKIMPDPFAETIEKAR